MARKQPVEPPPPDVPRLATPAQVAKYLHTTEAALAQMRYMGNGPKFIKAGGRRVLYNWDDLLEWIKKNTIQRTDDPRGGTMRDRDEQAIQKYLDKLDPNAANRRTVEQRPPTIVAQQRRLPGKPQPAGEFLAEYQEHNRKRRERIRGPLWAFWAPDPQDIFRWRIQLDCGCVEERIKHSLSDDDKPTRTIATTSDFDPLSRERLPPGEFLCSGKHRKRVKPIHDIADWGERKVREFPADPIEPPEMWADQPDIWAVIRHPEPHQSAFWKALLVCGHFADVVTDVDWKPEDDPTYPTPKRLEEMRAEEADLDKWHKRLLAADWPRPAPFREC